MRLSKTRANTGLLIETMSTIENAEKSLDELLRGINVERNLSVVLSAPEESLGKLFNNARTIAIADSAISEMCRVLLCDFASPKLTIKQTKFLMDCIIYVGDATVVKENYAPLLVIAERNSSEMLQDSLFWKGLIQYRCGNYFSAQNEFQKLLAFKESLQFHQTGCISYFHEWAPKSETAKAATISFRKLAVTNSNGVVLISCDYGYFSAYSEKAIAGLLSSGAAAHFHLVLPAGFDLNRLLSLDHPNVGVSYEYEDAAERRNRKTYYSIARYLVCPAVIEEYKKPVLIADIDIDFNMDLSSLFEKIDDDEIALVCGKRNLPWLRILAGFNLFGKGASRSAFLTYLNQFLLFCYSSGRDGWMLDQTALDLAYRSTRDLSNIQNIDRIKSFSVRQHANRAVFRRQSADALKALIISDGHPDR